ncbi:hypothetical protein AGMMS50218_10160 [Actinomycetota bacterium]|nr:hypothetical protein AGMMS50218_10160 [Actinomycetota bacterium]
MDGVPEDVQGQVGARYTGPLISGGQAVIWSRRAFPFLVTFVALGAVIASEIFLHWGLRDGWGFWIQLDAWVAFALASVVLIAIQAVQDVRESRLGYTTGYGVRQALVQIDPVTRRVIRPAGAPFVTAKQVRAQQQSGG